MNTTEKPLKKFASKGTLLGCRAESMEVRRGGPKGVRVVFTKWVDAADQRSGGYAAGTVTVKVIKGDGRDVSGVLLADEVVVPSEQFGDIDVASSLLAQFI